MRFLALGLMGLLTSALAYATSLEDFRAIEGTYTGQIVGKETVPVVIILTVAGTVDQPVLTGFYKRPDVASGAIDLPIQVINYDPTAAGENLSMEAHGTNRYHLYFMGSVRGGQMHVRVTSAYLGYMGVADLTRP